MIPERFKQLTESLPPDPNSAIVEFASRVEVWLAEPSNEEADTYVFHAIKQFYEKFINRFSIPVELLPFTDGAGFSKWTENQTSLVLEYGEKFVEAEVSREVGDMIDQIETQFSGETFGIARLNKTEKLKIHESIQRIREIISDSNFPDRKKNALFSRLNELSKEVDMHGTRTDRFFSFASDIAFAVGDATKKAKPLFDEVKDVLRIVGRSRARQEGISLPPGDDTLLLPDAGNV